MLKPNKIYCGDCLNVMKDIDSDSVDCIVTDPPYGMSFMGKSWDICPSVEIWQECLRVLKPGAFAFVMCIPRQDCLARMICWLKDAGFNVAFSSIYWTYASGFPKAASLSKQADKRAGADRKIIGTKNLHAYSKKDHQKSQCPHNDFEKVNQLTIPSSPEAKALDGAYSGMQLKPAVEIVIVAMKPLEEKTYVDQALKNGHGCTWLDDTRIPFEKADIANRHKNNTFKLKAKTEHNSLQMEGWGLNKEKREIDCYNNKGRFPANVLCEDDVLNDGVDRKSGGRTFKDKQREKSIFNTGGVHYTEINPNEGSFSRYFSLDAWFAERIKQLPKEAQKTFPWLIVPKASKSEKNRGLEDMGDKKGNNNLMASKEVMRGHPEKGKPVWSENKEPLKVKNNHPTTKPLKLMSWLITLASREGDTVLDPFCGSGTTAIAAKMLDRQYIGIEKEEEYCEIARKRLGAILTNLSSF